MLLTKPTDSIGDRSRALLSYINTKNGHGRQTLMRVVEKLALTESDFYKYLSTEATANIGKNQLKDKMLELMVAKLK